MSIVDDVKEKTDDIRTKVYGREVRSSIADGIDEIAEVVDTAVSNQIADYDAFMIERRYPKNGKEFYSIIPGGITKYGYPSTDSSSKYGVTSAIEITKPVLIKIVDNTGDNYYQINRVWGYTDTAGTTPEATAINYENPLGRDGTLLILPVSGRVSFRVSFRRLDDNVAVDTTELSQKFRVYTAMDSDVIYDGRDKLKNTPKVLTWFTDGLSADFTSLADMPPWSITLTKGEKLKEGLLDPERFDIDDLISADSYILRKEEYGIKGSYFYRYILSTLGATKTWIGFTLINNSTIRWHKVIQPTDKTLSVENAPADAAAVGAALESNSSRVRILVFGNSFSYSDLGLVPAILNECGVRVEFGILYKSGATIQDHIDRFNNDQSYEAFSYCDGTRWTNNWINPDETMTNKANTARNILRKTKWDYIVFQSGDPTGLETLADLVTNFIYNDATILENFGSYPVSYLFNCNHCKGANCKYRPNDPTSDVLGEPVSNQRLLDYASRAEKLLEDGNFILDILPCGTAVQNARQLEVFKKIGDVDKVDGYLCHDHAGHLQNGIATLIPAYAATLKILEVIGCKQKIYGSQIRPTDTWLEQYNLLTRGRESTDPFYGVSHGPSEGLTEENVLLAAKCAVQAYKHPYQITDITGNSPAITNPPSEGFSRMAREACAYRVHVVLNNNVATMRESFADILAAHNAGKLIEIEVNIGNTKVYGILNAESVKDTSGDVNGLIFSVTLDLAITSGEPGTEPEPDPKLLQVVVGPNSVAVNELKLEKASQ